MVGRSCRMAAMSDLGVPDPLDDVEAALQLLIGAVRRLRSQRDVPAPMGQLETVVGATQKVEEIRNALRDFGGVRKDPYAEMAFADAAEDGDDSGSAA